MKARTKRAKPKKTPRFVFCEECKWFSPLDDASRFFSPGRSGLASAVGICCNPRSQQYMHNITNCKHSCPHSRPYPLIRRIIVSIKGRPKK